MIKNFTGPYFFFILLADLKLADIRPTNHNSGLPDCTACNLRIQKQHQILISIP